MYQLKYVVKHYSDSGAFFRFIREGADITKDRSYLAEEISKASMNRIRTMLGGAFFTEIDHTIDQEYARVSYRRVGSPQRFDVGVYQNIRGDLVITADSRARVEMRRRCADNPYSKGDIHVSDTWYYPHMNEVFHELLDGTDLEFWSSCAEGLAMFDGPGILLRDYFPEDHPECNDGDDDKNTNWDRSNLWAFQDYVFRHPAEDLIAKGYVVFKNAET